MKKVSLKDQKEKIITKNIQIGKDVKILICIIQDSKNQRHYPQNKENYSWIKSYQNKGFNIDYLKILFNSEETDFSFLKISEKILVSKDLMYLDNDGEIPAFRLIFQYCYSYRDFDYLIITDLLTYINPEELLVRSFWDFYLYGPLILHKNFIRKFLIRKKHKYSLKLPKDYDIINSKLFNNTTFDVGSFQKWIQNLLPKIFIPDHLINQSPINYFLEINNDNKSQPNKYIFLNQNIRNLKLIEHNDSNIQIKTCKFDLIIFYPLEIDIPTLDRILTNLQSILLEFSNTFIYHIVIDQKHWINFNIFRNLDFFHFHSPNKINNIVTINSSIVFLDLTNNNVASIPILQSLLTYNNKETLVEKETLVIKKYLLDRLGGIGEYPIPRYNLNGLILLAQVIDNVNSDNVNPDNFKVITNPSNHKSKFEEWVDFHFQTKYQSFLNITTIDSKTKRILALKLAESRKTPFLESKFQIQPKSLWKYCRPILMYGSLVKIKMKETKQTWFVRFFAKKQEYKYKYKYDYNPIIDSQQLIIELIRKKKYEFPTMNQAIIKHNLIGDLRTLNNKFFVLGDSIILKDGNKQYSYKIKEIKH